MPNKKKIIPEQIPVDKPKFKVKLDAKTTIIILNKASLSIWLKRYPEARIIA